MQREIKRVVIPSVGAFYRTSFSGFASQRLSNIHRPRLQGHIEGEPHGQCALENPLIYLTGQVHRTGYPTYRSGSTGVTEPMWTRKGLVD